MLKKGLFGLDDYVKFGKFIDSMIDKVAFITISKNGINIACRIADLDDVLRTLNEFGGVVEKRSSRGGMTYIKVRI